MTLIHAVIKRYAITNLKNTVLPKIKVNINSPIRTLLSDANKLVEQLNIIVTVIVNKKSITTINLTKIIITKEAVKMLIRNFIMDIKPKCSYSCIKF